MDVTMPWLKDSSDPNTLLPQMVLKRSTAACEASPSQDAASVTQPAFTLTCRSCRKARKCHQVRLVKDARWTRIWCKCCKKVKISSTWLCPCDIAWYTCSKHRAAGFKCKPKATPGTRPSTNERGNAKKQRIGERRSKDKEAQRSEDKEAQASQRKKKRPLGQQVGLETGVLLRKCPRLAERFPDLANSR